MAKIITVIGFGNVGRVLVTLLLGTEKPIHLNIVDPADWLSGAFLDIKHSMGMQAEKRISFNDVSLLETSDFVFFTAGVPNTRGASRLSKTDDNVQLVREVFEQKVLKSSMYIIAITNPVDVITAAIIKYSGLPANQVVGTGTYLDSMRFAFEISELAAVDYLDIEAMILGEHGDSCVPVYSNCSYRKKTIKDLNLFSENLMNKALDRTQNAATEIRKTEPGTSMAVSHCALRIMEFLQQDEEKFIAASVLLSEQWKQRLELDRTVCMSVPVGISSQGIHVKAPLELEQGELEALKKSAQVLAKYQKFL